MVSWSDVQYLEKSHEPHNDLPFLPERRKIKKVEKLVTNLLDTTEYVIHIRNFHIKIVHIVIKFNQNNWLKPYINMNKNLRKRARNDFVKGFFKLMNNAVFQKTIENVRKHKVIKLVITEWKINYLE